MRRMILKMVSVGVTAALAAVAGFAGQAAAQAWPDKPVKFIVPTPAGSAPDIAARLIGEKLAARWGQPVVIDNRAGAGGIPAMSAFTRSPADGYTFGFIHAGVIALTPHLFKNPQFNFDTDVVTVSTVVSGAMVVVVNPSLGVSTFPELVKMAKARPGKLVFAAPLLNSVPHLTGELLARTAGIELQTIPYNGTAAAVTAMLSGQGADVIIDSPAPLMPSIKAGKMKAIAVTSPRRFPGLDDVATVGDTLTGFDASGWFALFAPAKTPANIVERVNRDVNAVIQQPDVAARFAELGLYPSLGTVAQSGAFVTRERERWGKVIRDMGIKPE